MSSNSSSHSLSAGPLEEGVGKWYGKGLLSAGILPYREREGELEVFLVHPGGPFFAKKDEGVWNIPKGRVEQEEAPLAAALREFTEETGFAPPRPNHLHFLGEAVYPTGKRVMVWATEMPRLNPARLRSNLVHTTLDGKLASWPEVDRAEWFPLREALRKIFAPLRKLLGDLPKLVNAASQERK